MPRAYEISTYWHENPPPPEILENLTAKGGDLRNRTLENFHVPASRDSGVLADGLESADDEQRTPKADPMDVDEPGSGGRYPTSKLFQKNP
jgi:chromatin structure-remodeling complex subunit RSC9